MTPHAPLSARSLAVGVATSLALAGAGMMTVSFAAVIGESRSIQIAPPITASLDRMRDEYRRPTSIPFPQDNPYTLVKAELGKKLYFDPRLSASGAQSCSSCHNPSLAWGDGLALGVGHNMKQLGRRSPTIINGAFQQMFMWDSRFSTLEEQALGPIQSSDEMNMSAAQAEARIKAIPQYKAMFAAAFADGKITLQNIGRAIATYERTVVSARAPFDVWIDGDQTAISEQAKKGFAVFNTKANCSACHGGWNFTDDSTHDIGLASADLGRGKFLPDVEKMQFAFKTPSLREISRRAPFMHDGSIRTLDAVIDHYDGGGIARPSRSEAIKPLNLTPAEKSDLLAFLETLTAASDPTAVPKLPY